MLFRSHSSPVIGSISSESSPAAVRRSSISPNNARASSFLPVRCNASISQKVHMLNAVTGGPKSSGALRSEEHTSELQYLMRISYAVFCLKKKQKQPTATSYNHYS